MTYTPSTPESSQVKSELEKAVARLVTGGFYRTGSDRWRFRYAPSAGPTSVPRQTVVVESAFTHLSEHRTCAPRQIVAVPSDSGDEGDETSGGDGSGGGGGGGAGADDGSDVSSDVQKMTSISESVVDSENEDTELEGQQQQQYHQQQQMTVLAAARAVWAIVATAEQVAAMTLRHVPNEEEEIIQAARSASSGLNELGRLAAQPSFDLPRTGRRNSVVGMTASLSLSSPSPSLLSPSPSARAHNPLSPTAKRSLRGDGNF